MLQWVACVHHSSQRLLSPDLIAKKVFFLLFPCLGDFAPGKLEVGVREHILKDLENFVRRQFAGDVHSFVCFIWFNFLNHNCTWLLTLKDFYVCFYLNFFFFFVLRSGSATTVRLVEKWFWLQTERPRHLHDLGGTRNFKCKLLNCFLVPPYNYFYDCSLYMSHTCCWVAFICVCYWIFIPFQ